MDTMVRRFLQKLFSPVALGILPLLLTVSLADAQAKGKAAKDPCDPTYVPPKGTPPPVCPGVTQVTIEPAQGTATLAPTPAPVESQKKRAADPRAIVNAPGFRMMPDGSSKLFLEIHGSPSIKQIITRSGVTYVLSDARVPVNNNRRPLMTQYFNTPISDARLAQFRNDVHLRIDLRAASAPTARLTELISGKVMLLEVAFPAGSYRQQMPGDVPRRRGSRSASGSSSSSSSTSSSGSAAPSSRSTSPKDPTSGTVLGPPSP